ncbi:MAG: glycoside hydrolase family 127 protein [Candidatus Heimdallarchaeota archaeon]|nr:glycoside hydrolase family 127 protein [Candidatus Heimdallarchaeota archaeon]
MEIQQYPLRSIEIINCKLGDKFWFPRQKINNDRTIPHNFDKCEETGRLDNFRIAAGRKEGTFRGICYDDSDVFKVMEGAAHSLILNLNDELEVFMDEFIEIIADAQEEDGYLYTIRTILKEDTGGIAGKSRWSNLLMSHELYNAGHMYEAALAYYKATGKTNFMEIAIKHFELIKQTFGPNENQLHIPPGHQEIELALVKLYDSTGREDMLTMAKYFMDIRGDKSTHKIHSIAGLQAVFQDHLPVVNQTEAKGHAVRACYGYAGMTDIAALYNDDQYRQAVKTLWKDIVEYRLMLTGGIGEWRITEGFSRKYNLKNFISYNESCAALSLILFSHRLFLLFKQVKYMDLIERILYNGLLAGLSLEGDAYFYPNPLESDGIFRFNTGYRSGGSTTRSPWFSTSCCPTNFARFLPQIARYAYAESKDSIYINLFIAGSVNLHDCAFTVRTEYPWDGKIQIEIDKEVCRTLKIRVPHWLRGKVVDSNLYEYTSPLFLSTINVRINDEEWEIDVIDGYITLDQTLERGDIISFEFPMPVMKVRAHPKLKENRGKLSIERGPLVYCAEEKDNGSALNLIIDERATYSTFFNEDLLKGVVTIQTTGYFRNRSLGERWRMKTKNWVWWHKRYLSGILGRWTIELAKRKRIRGQKQITLIPYYAWGNRGGNEMIVWFKYHT